MPSLEDLENLALFGTGVGVGRSPRATGKAFLKAGRFAARRYPVGVVALGLWEAHKRGYLNERDWKRAAQELQEGLEESKFLGGAEVGPLAALPMPKVGKVKRKVSKANRAMKKAMKATKNNFKQSTKIASKANPNTKSKIGKGGTKNKRLARKIRKSVWGVTKRFKK
jgi:hypothetical protein